MPRSSPLRLTNFRVKNEPCLGLNNHKYNNEHTEQTIHGDKNVKKLEKNVADMEQTVGKSEHELSWLKKGTVSKLLRIDVLANTEFV